jgi:aminoglycoside 2'-N-acetyltransferase I
VDIEVVESALIPPRDRSALRALWDRAFCSDFTDDDAEHAYGGIHVLVRDADTIIGHASAVPRSIRVGDRPWCTVGYVEAVATDPDRQRQGVGRLAMERLQLEIASRWGVAFLSTGQATGFYERLGWARWQGLSYTARDDEVVADGEHGGLMVYGHESAGVDRTLAVTCRDRPGDGW